MKSDEGAPAHNEVGGNQFQEGLQTHSMSFEVQPEKFSSPHNLSYGQQEYVPKAQTGR